jgi:PKD repeat protein
MRLRSALLLALLVLPAASEASRGRRNELLRVVAPPSRGTANAHPFVNLIVRFGDGADADTFRARLNGDEITGQFHPVMERGAVVGMRARVEPPLVRVGRRNNRLRLEVRSVRPRGKNGRLGKAGRDVDRVRFKAVEAANEPPVARILPEAYDIVPGRPFGFTAAVTDPDLDEIDYAWNFGDGQTSSEPAPRHTFDVAAPEVTVRLAVSDGQATASDEERLFVCPSVDDGRTPGVLRLEASERLEFGAVALGGLQTRRLTVRNTGAPATQLRVRFDACAETARAGASGACPPPGWTITPSTFELAGGESTEVAVDFAPVAEGHQEAKIVAVASAANGCVAHMLAHGFGGVAPDSGPTLAGETVFYTDSPSTVPGTGTFGIMPDGRRFYADNSVHFCQSPNNGAGSGDYCLRDADCINGGTCLLASTCVRGDRAGQPCTVLADCPGGFCPSHTDFETLDVCGDGAGGLFILSDEGTFTDVAPTGTEKSGSLLRLAFDANGNRTTAQILSRVTTQTGQLACDRIAATNGGRVYLAEYHDVAAAPNCFRDGRESLTALRKTTGVSSALVPRIDAAEGLGECSDDYDSVEDLQVSANGAAAFATLPTGLYRVLPSPLLITPDATDTFQVHPDGSVVVVTGSDPDGGSTGLLRVFKIAPGQAVHGAVRLNDANACAVLPVRNNTTAGRSGRTLVVAYAAGRAAPGSNDGVVLVNFVTTGGTSGGTGGTAPLTSTLRIQATAAFAAPAGASTCRFLGFIGVDVLDQLTF